MVTDPASRRAPRAAQRTQRPIDAARLEAMALAYVARFATSRAKLETYLARKLRERGWEGDETPPVEAIAERFVAAGYIDDAGYARARSGSLLRRGYGERRVGQALVAAGIDEATRNEVRASAREVRRAALAMARKRRFGPFGSEAPERARREKQLAAMLRAGHRMDSARAAIDAATIEAAEEWADTDEE